MKHHLRQLFSKFLKLPCFPKLRFPKLSKLDWLVIKFFAALLLLMVGMCHIHLLSQDLRSSFELRHIEALNKKLKEQETGKGSTREQGK